MIRAHGLLLRRQRHGLYNGRLLQQSLRFKSSTSTSKYLSRPMTAMANNENDDKKKKLKKKKLETKKFDFTLGVRRLIPEWKRMFAKETLFTDISAGVTVGCIAVPLSLAIAVASGVPAEVGLVTAAVSGIAGSAMGGTTLAITGPAAAISLLVVGAVEQHGLEALPFITFACGGLQVASGVTRLGLYAKLVPVSVIAGFTTGVGTLILTGQIPKALGMIAPHGLNTLDLMMWVSQHAANINPHAAALAVGTSAAMFMLPKLHPKMPSALLAVGGATAATHTLGLDVSLIGSIPAGFDAFALAMPALPPMEALPSLMTSTLLIYSMTSVESLLSCAALEKMKKTSYKHNPDQELVGQGLANVGASLFFGMPVTSVIARSSLNVRLNASTRLPGFVQSAFVFSSVVFFSEGIAMVPMSALSGVLITTGMGMLNPTEFKHCYAVQKSDVIPFATTVAGMLSMGLAEGIGIGCLSALALNKNWTGKAPSKMTAKRLTADADNDSTSTADKDTLTYQLSGPINFLSMFEIDSMMKSVKNEMANNEPTNLIIDLKDVPSQEFTGVEEMVLRLMEVQDDISIQLVNVSQGMEDALQQCDPNATIPRLPLQD